MSFGNPQIISSAGSMNVQPEPVFAAPGPRLPSQFFNANPGMATVVLVPSGLDDTQQINNALALGRVSPSNPFGGVSVLLGPGIFQISSPIQWPQQWGVNLVGCGKQVTVIQQNTDNVAIINFGAYGGNPTHSNRVQGICFQYLNFQPVANTGAIPWLFNVMLYESLFYDCTFENGYYAMSVAAGIGQPWGSTFDELVFGGNISGGAFDFSQGLAGGYPNNRWGRMQFIGINMAGPIVNAVRGYNWTVDTLEFLQVNLGARLFSLTQQVLTIGALKVEIGNWGAGSAGFALLEMSGCLLKISQLHMTTGGAGDQLVCNVGAGNKLYLIRNSGQQTNGQPAKTDIDFLRASFTITSGTVFALFTGASSSNGFFEIGSILDMTNISLVDSISSASAEVVKIRDYNNDHMTQDLGDANDTVTLGAPNIRCFNTAFTAQRTMALPNVQQSIPNGLYYEYAFAAGTLTNFGALLTCNGVTLVTLAAQATGVIVRFTFRRSTANVQSGWRVTKYETGVPV